MRAEGFRLGLFCEPGPAAEALLEQLSANDAIAALVPVAGNAEGGTLVWRGRPVAVRAAEDVAPTMFDGVVFLNDPALAERWLDPMLDAGLLVLDGTDTLAQRGETPMYFGGSLSGGDRQLAIADAASSHCAAFLDCLGQPLTSVSIGAAMPVSQHGKRGIEALAAESARLLNGQPVDEHALGQQIAFNVLPDFFGQGAAQLEQQLGWRLGEGVDIRCHHFTVPVFYGHTLSLIVECTSSPELAKLRAALAADERFQWSNEGDGGVSAASLAEQTGIHVANLSLDRRDSRRLRCTLVGDSLRDGVVRNVASALEILIKNDM